jgi:hypothetical protein
MQDLSENRERTQVFIIDASGALISLGTTESGITLDCEGRRTFSERTFYIAAHGRVLTEPSRVPLFSCACGKTLLTEASVFVCQCGLPVCRAHAHPVPEVAADAVLCDACWQAARRTIKWQRFRTWLTTFKA